MAIKTNKLYIITGTPGVGKSTISREIAKRCEKSALIEGDIIYHLVCGGYENPWEKGNHLKVFGKNSIDLICNFLNNGYDVVFNYIINKGKIEELKNEFRKIYSNSLEIKFVVLLADEKIILKRDKQRPEEVQMKERVLVLLESFINQKFDKQNILDTSNISIIETLEKILKIINLY